MQVTLYWFIVHRYLFLFFELLTCFNLFFRAFTKKKMYWLKQFIGCIVGIGLCMLLAWLILPSTKTGTENPINSIIVNASTYFLIFIFLCIYCSLLYKTRLYSLMFYATAAYAVQHFLFDAYLVSFSFSGSSYLVYNYQKLPLWAFVSYLFFWGVLLYLVNVLLVKKMILIRKDETFGKSIIILFLSAIMINVVIGSVVERYSTNLESYDVMYICTLLAQMVCLFIIVYTQIHILIRLRINNENRMIMDLLKEKEQEYQYSLANAELISIKAHDLKHQVIALREGGEVRERVLQDLEGVIQSYESIITTGNVVIDVVLSEKWKYCTDNNIKLSCTVDPNALANLDKTDLYSILGNVLDNAIEAVMKIDNPDKRVISLVIQNKAGLSILTTNNYYEGTLKFRDDLPLTTKKDSSFHGFGMRSIKLIIKKYDGVISITPDNGIFILQITIPN